MEILESLDDLRAEIDELDDGRNKSNNSKSLCHCFGIVCSCSCLLASEMHLLSGDALSQHGPSATVEWLA